MAQHACCLPVLLVQVVRTAATAAPILLVVLPKVVGLASSLLPPPPPLPRLGGARVVKHWQRRGPEEIDVVTILVGVNPAVVEVPLLTAVHRRPFNRPSRALSVVSMASNNGPRIEPGKLPP